MKIAFIGGGSYSWGPTLLGDLALSESLQGQICLMDIDPVAGERLRRLGEHYLQQTHAPLHLTYTPLLAEALDGADYVILSITTGGLEAMRGDLEIPARYGIMQTVGDTVGPGGIARALRNIPVVVAIAQEMERRCPTAWLINVTNPMTTLCRAVTKATGVCAIGLCHEVFSVRRRAATLLDGEGGLPAWQVAGINHLPWIVGVDTATLAGFHERMLRALPPSDRDDDPFEDSFRVKMDLLELYGTFPAAGDRHVAEFFPSYLANAEEARDAYGLRFTSISDRAANLARSVDAVLRHVEGHAAVTPRQSHEQAVPAIEALAGFRQGEFVVNIPNDGQIAGLPAGAVVEGMATIDAGGIHPHEAPGLNAAVLAWLHIHVAAQELVVEAALEGRFDSALQAMLLDPLSYRLRPHEARTMLRELVAYSTRFGPAAIPDCSGQYRAR